MNNTVPPLASLAAGIIALVLSVVEGDALVAAMAFAVSAVSAALAVQSRRYAVDPVFCLIAAVTCLVSTYILLYVFEWYNGNDMSLAYSEGFVAWISVFPTAYLLVTVFVNASGAILNRILAPAFTAFSSVGIMTLVWVFISVFFVPELDVKYWFAQEMAYLFVDIVLSAAVAVSAAVLLKGRHYRLQRREVSA